MELYFFSYIIWKSLINGFHLIDRDDIHNMRSAAMFMLAFDVPSASKTDMSIAVVVACNAQSG